MNFFNSTLKVLFYCSALTFIASSFNGCSNSSETGVTFSPNPIVSESSSFNNNTTADFSRVEYDFINENRSFYGFLTREAKEEYFSDAQADEVVNLPEGVSLNDIVVKKGGALEEGFHFEMISKERTVELLETDDSPEGFSRQFSNFITHMDASFEAKSRLKYDLKVEGETGPAAINFLFSNGIAFVEDFTASNGDRVDEGFVIIPSNFTFTSVDSSRTESEVSRNFSGDLDLSIETPIESRITASTNELSEVSEGGGELEGEITLSLSGDTFSQNSGSFVEGTHYTLSGESIPQGLSLFVQLNSNTQAVVSFNGSASLNDASNSVEGIVITFQPEAFTSSVLPQEGSHILNMDISFIDDPTSSASLSYVQTALSESAANDGSFDTNFNIGISGDTFVLSSGIYTLNTHYTLTGANIPPGLAAELQATSSNNARLVLNGNANSHAMADSVTGINLTFLDAAFTQGQAPIDGSQSQDLSLTFNDPQSIMLYTAGEQSGDLMGRFGADILCAGSQPGSSMHLNTIALISIDSNDEIRDMPTEYSVPTMIPIQSENGTVIANNWADFLDGTISNSFTAANVSPNDRWWSGADNSGALATNSCVNWTDNSGFESGATGLMSATSSFMAGGMDQNCDELSIDLLCIAFD